MTNTTDSESPEDEREQVAEQIKQPNCEHDTSDARLRIDTYLGTDERGRERWGRKCLRCGAKTEFTYDH